MSEQSTMMRFDINSAQKTSKLWLYFIFFMFILYIKIMSNYDSNNENIKQVQQSSYPTP